MDSHEGSYDNYEPEPGDLPDYPARLQEEARWLDPRAGDLLAQIPTDYDEDVEVDFERDPGTGEVYAAGGIVFPYVTLLARSDDETQLLVEVKGLLATAAARAGIAKLWVRPGPYEPLLLYDSEDTDPSREELVKAVQVLDRSSEKAPESKATPKRKATTSGVPIEVVDGFEFTPIELPVYHALQDMDLIFTPQCWILHHGRKLYRVDFMIYYGGRAIALELDGHESHKTKEQRTYDAGRERFLKSRGIDVIRFTGSEIYKDLQSCMFELIDVLTQRKATTI